MKKKILFVNDEMVVGGVSKVLNNLLNHFDYEKYEVTLLVLHKRGEMLKDVPNHVKVIEGTSFFDVCDIPFRECMKQRKLIKKIFFYLLIKTGHIEKKIIKERKIMKLSGYDVEIAFKEGICSLFTASGNSSKKINWIHADYKVKNYAKNYMNTMKRLLAKMDFHVAVSNVAANSFKEIFNLKEVITIHNIIESDKILERADEKVDYRDDIFTFITVGRLHPQKSYDRLLEAVDRLNKKDFLFKVYLIGDGEEKEKLEEMKNKLSLDNVYFLGNKSNPFPYVKLADAFVLSSLYEGLPTVVYESMILKVPVISVEVAGIQEQLENKYGLIVENSLLGLEEGMEKFIKDNQLIAGYKNNLNNFSYDNEQIMKQIYDLLEK